jgi:hypothetical protein
MALLTYCVDRSTIFSCGGKADADGLPFKAVWLLTKRRRLKGGAPVVHTPLFAETSFEQLLTNPFSSVIAVVRKDGLHCGTVAS